MNLSDADIELINEYKKARDALVKAKKLRKRGHPDPEALTAAKARVDELRTYWRRIGEAVGVRTPIAPIQKRG